MRKAQLANHEYYHIYNRGVDKRDIFSDNKDYERFILSMLLMNDEKDGLMIRWRNFQASHPSSSVNEFLRLNLSERKELVGIIAYCCNSNHYHFILKQLRDRGIERFMQRVATGYTMYYNEKYHRTGSLFQGRFKSSHIKYEGSLLRMGVYVSCNSEVHKICQAKNYSWCSFPHHIGKIKNDFIKDKEFRGQFRSIEDLEKYAKENVAGFQTRKQDKDLVFE